MMRPKREKTFDGLFTGERVTFDLTQPMDPETWAEFCRVTEGSSVVAQIAKYETYIAERSQSAPPFVALRLDRMRKALALAKQGGPRDAVLIAMQSAELQRREIEALPVLHRAAPFLRYGRSAGAVGPLRVLVRQVLNAESKAGRLPKRGVTRHLWEVCKSLPDRKRRGMDFYDDHLWIDAGDHGGHNVTFERFANIVSEERNPKPRS
jgi:hypothetical protein